MPTPNKTAKPNKSKVSARPAKPTKKKSSKPKTPSPSLAAKVPKSASPRKKSPASLSSTPPSTPHLLSSGNPQIPLGYGDAPVQAYIAAMPGWKSPIGQRIDSLITQTIPRSTPLRKAVKWNTPLYGVGPEDQGWFLAMYCYAKYISLTFFRGSSLTPPPPDTSKIKEVRYLKIHEGDLGHKLPESQLIDWINQASKLPGEHL